ncbi:MAG: PP2C family protein-serine/threonine phosphatase [Phycisphaerae bacterium]
MPDIRDFINVDLLRQIQDAFSAVASAPIRVCDRDGEPILGGYCLKPDDNEVLRAESIDPGVHCGDLCEEDGCYVVPVMHGDEVLGCLRTQLPPSLEVDQRERSRIVRLLRLAANLTVRLGERESQLRSRVEELSVLYRLTAEFTGERDIQNLLDVVAQTVVDVLKVKACSIRLLSEERTELVVHSVANLSAEYLEKGPILVSASQLDQEVIRTGEIIYIADEQNDPRVLYPAEARREGIVSALIAPMLYKGQPEGVIHVYTSEQHEFDWFEMSLLRTISAEAAAAIVNARLNEEALHSAQVHRALSMAAEVQRRMIPSKPPTIPGLDIAALYVPSYQLSGDFYDFIELPQNNVGLAICDVAGKGVRASLLMAMIRGSLRAHALNVYEMSTVLDKVNRDLVTASQTSDFATMFYGVMDVNQRIFTYTNAGHLPPMLYRDGQICHLNTSGGVLGITPDVHYPHEWFGLKSGDVVLAFTDGIPEALNFQDEAFGRARVEKALVAAVEKMAADANGICKHVLWEMRRFAGLQTRQDDVTMLAVRVL